MASNFCFLCTELGCDASLHRVHIISNPGLGHGRSRGKEKTLRACNLDRPRIPAGRCWRRSVDDKPLYCSLYLDAPSSSSSSSQTVVVEPDSLSSAHSRVLYDPAFCESRRRGERLGAWQRGQRRVGSLCSLREHAEHSGGSGHLSQCSVSDARGEVLNAPLHDGSSRRQRHNFEEKGSEQEEDLVTEGEESNALVTFEETEGDLQIDVENSLVSGSILPVEVDRLEPSDDTVRCGETSGQKYGKHEEGIRDSSVGVKRESSRDVENLKVNGATGLLHRKKEESKVVRTAWEKLVRWSRSWQLLNAGKSSNALASTKKVVVLGGGSFGTAMAVLLARNKAEMNVILLLRDAVVCQTINEHHLNLKYFPNHQLPKNVGATTNAKEALKDAQFCVHAVPVQSSSAFLRSIAEHVPANLPFLSVSKGLELSTLEMMSQVIPRSLGNPRQPVAVISGPSFAIELMDELPTGMVAASRDKALALSAQQLLASRYLRVNTSNDVIGVEMAGALKNVLAIAAGIVEGMQLGNNCMAALVAQGCSEIRWLAEKMGAKSTTLSGLSGSGDIMLTCFVTLSRNRSVGVRLGSGEKLEDILSSMKQVAEGVATAGAVISLAKKYRVQMPVLTAVARILDNELTPKTAVLALMSLPQVEEV